MARVCMGHPSRTGDLSRRQPRQTETAEFAKILRSGNPRFMNGGACFRDRLARTQTTFRLCGWTYRQAFL